MLEALTVEKFQIHDVVHVDFDRYVTTLVGPTRAGKTAILRALRWAACNQPRGDAFLQHGASVVTSSLRVDGSVVQRQRGDGCNTYKLDEAVYHAFGNEVPHTISALVNLAPVNFQFQLDPPYLLSLTPGDVARELNKVVNLSLIDATLADMATEHRKARATLEVSKTRLKEAKERKRALAWVKKADAAWKEVETLQASIEESQTAIAALQTYISGLQAIDTDAARYTVEVVLLADVVDLGDELMQAQEGVRALEGALSEYNNLCGQTDRLQEELQALEQELHEGLQGQCPICGNEFKHHEKAD